MRGGGKYQALYDALFALYGECACPLEYSTPFQLLTAVVLSAQCRDERVNQVTRILFRRAPDPAGMVAAGEDEVADIIRPCGLFRVKARNIVAMSAVLISRFHGEVPHTMDELVSLPGVGRKSANVLLGNAFGLPGFPADTHVTRLLTRIGLAKRRDPVKIEAAVNAALSPDLWCNFSHLLITHGRRVCHAGCPDCAGCAVSELCKSYGKVK